MMISFDKPQNLDGAKLVDEILGAGIKIEADDRYYAQVTPPYLDGENQLWLAISDKDFAKAKTIVDSHNG